MKPLLPLAEKILPYLEKIDRNRHYTNFGPLNASYQERLEVVFKAPVVTASSATSALTACLMAYDLPPKSFVACPSWTFVATPLSIMAAGHIPYFMDVDDAGRFISKSFIYPVCRAVVAVAPFGKPINVEAWDDFELPVVIDAAAGFDAFSSICYPQNRPVVISTHATKTFGTGEGGLVVCKNKSLLEKVRKITSFGLTPEREVLFPAFNAKFSEYHAAVGHAELDGWATKRERFLEETRVFGLDYAVTMVPVRGQEGRKLVYGCHKHLAFKNCPRTNLPLTEEMMENISLIEISI